MTQYDFETHFRPLWQAFEKDTAALESFSSAGKAPLLFLRHYRMISRHLALAQERGYSPALTEYLGRLVARGHRLVYRQKTPLLPRLKLWLLDDLPQSVRAEMPLFLWAHAFFYIPLAVFLVLCLIFPDLYGRLFGEFSAWSLGESYRQMAQQNAGGIDRALPERFLMFGYYVFNNIGIAFQCLGSGFLLAVGTLWVLVSNGIHIGAAMGYMPHSGAGAAFYGFIGGHGAFELTGIILAGMAGLRVGLALLNPQGYSRPDALKIHGKSAGALMSGAFFFLLLAAAVEAFWSPSAVPDAFKIMVALFLWPTVYFYLLRSGRHYG